MIIILLIVPVDTNHYGRTDTILKPSYGTIFTKLGVVNNGNSYWSHVFSVPLMKMKTPSDIVAQNEEILQLLQCSLGHGALWTIWITATSGNKILISSTGH